MFEKLRRGDALAVREFDNFGDFFENLDYAQVFVDFDAFLLVISVNDGGSGVDFARICGLVAGNNVQKGAFAHAVASDDANALAALELITEIIKYNRIAESFAHVGHVEDFAAHARHVHFETHFRTVIPLFRLFLGFVKR